jgi:hypothetical protein
MKVQYRKHPSLYVLDGNIALIAREAQSVHECVVFRVHRSMLSRFSAVFETMMTTTENYDGVPAVCMTDPADQIESLLKFMYHEMYVSFRCPFHTCLKLSPDSCHPESVTPIKSSL